MGQYEIYNFLLKNKGKWFTTKELAEKLGLNTTTISYNIRQLLKWKLVESRLGYSKELRGQMSRFIRIP